jgi:hypothetical protein
METSNILNQRTGAVATILLGIFVAFPGAMIAGIFEAWKVGQWLIVAGIVPFLIGAAWGIFGPDHVVVKKGSGNPAKVIPSILVVIIVCGLIANAQIPNSYYTTVVLSSHASLRRIENSLRKMPAPGLLTRTLDRESAIEMYEGLCMSIGTGAFPTCFDPIVSSPEVVTVTWPEFYLPETSEYVFHRGDAIALMNDLRQALHVPEPSATNDPWPYIDKADCEARAKGLR